MQKRTLSLMTTLSPSAASPVKTRLYQFSADEVAEELCLLDSELLRKIRAKELVGGVWMKEEVSGIG